MITSVEITRFRGIKQGRLDHLSPLVILVGPNGSGKSAILDAILLAASDDPRKHIERVRDRRPGVPDPARWLLWRGGLEGGSVLAVSLPPTPPVIKKQRGVQLWRVGDDPPFSPGGNSVVDAGGIKLSWHQRDTRMPIHLLDSSAFHQRAALHTLYSEAVRRDHRDTARKILETLIPDLQRVEILDENNQSVLYLIYAGRSIPAMFAGDGIQTLLHMTLELTLQTGGTVLLEEPEVYKHPGAMRQAARVIVEASRRDIQVILSTHSLELIDFIVSESTDEDLKRLSLYGTVLKDGELIADRLPGEDVAFSRTKVESDLR